MKLLTNGSIFTFALCKRCLNIEIVEPYSVERVKNINIGRCFNWKCNLPMVEFVQNIKARKESDKIKSDKVYRR